jgi:hypothetical protein
MYAESPFTPVNAIFCPSGDQVGVKSRVLPLVTRRTCEPSAFMTKMCSRFRPSRALVNAIRVPSGEYAGKPLFVA